MVETRQTPPRLAGEPKLIRQAIPVSGSSLLQDFIAVEQLDIHVVGFHPARDA